MKICLPKESYIAEDEDAYGKRLWQFAIPHMSDLPVAGSFFIEVSPSACSYTLDRSYEANVDSAIECYPASLLDICYKDQYECPSVSVEFLARETRGFSSAKYASARKAVLRRSKNIETLLVPKKDIEKEGEDFYTARVFLDALAHDFVLSKKDAKKRGDGSLLYPVSRDVVLNGLSIKDLERAFPLAEEKER